MLEIKGKIYEIFPIQTIKSTFFKRECVLLTEDQQYISFDALGNNIKLLEKFKVGDAVTVYFKLKGKLWMNPKGEKKYYNTLEIMDIQFSVTS